MPDLVELTSERHSRRMLVRMDGDELWLPTVPFAFLLGISLHFPDWVAGQDICDNPDPYYYGQWAHRLRKEVGFPTVEGDGLGYFRLRAKDVAIDRQLSKHPRYEINRLFTADIRTLSDDFLFGQWAKKTGPDSESDPRGSDYP